MHNPQGLFSGTYAFIFALPSASEMVHLDPLACIANLFAGSIILINSKVSFMSSGDKPILTSKISLINFCRFRYLEDFDFKIVHFGQNSSEPIAFR